MQDIKIVRNYAQALFDSAKHKQKHEVIFHHIKDFIAIINANSELKNILFSPITPKTDKIKLIFELTSNLKTDELLTEFLKVLIKNSREYILDHLEDYYKKLLVTSKDIACVKVKSAKTLNNKDRELLENHLEHDLIKRKLAIEYEEDSTLLGGMLIQYDNKIMDFSISSFLKKIDDIARSAIVK